VEREGILRMVVVVWCGQVEGAFCGVRNGYLMVVVTGDWVR
jgi:hypothetical protein